MPSGPLWNILSLSSLPSPPIPPSFHGHGRTSVKELRWPLFPLPWASHPLFLPHWNSLYFSLPPRPAHDNLAISVLRPPSSHTCQSTVLRGGLLVGAQLRCCSVAGGGAVWACAEGHSFMTAERWPTTTFTAGLGANKFILTSHQNSTLYSRRKCPDHQNAFPCKNSKLWKLIRDKWSLILR